MQTDMILHHLQQGNKITPLEALDRFGCFRLASRISELRKAGYPIEREIVKGDNGKRWAAYSLRVGC